MNSAFKTEFYLSVKAIFDLVFIMLEAASKEDNLIIRIAKFSRQNIQTQPLISKQRENLGKEFSNWKSDVRLQGTYRAIYKVQKCTESMI